MKVMRLGAIFAAVALAQCVAVPRVSAQEPSTTVGRSGQSEASLAPGTPIYAEFSGGVDSKKAKAGDVLTAQTIAAVKSGDGRMILARGAKLVGRLTQATARGKGDPESALGIVFDKAILKNGEEMALNVRMQALAAPVSFSVNDMGESPSPANAGTQQTSPMRGSRSGPPSSEPPTGIGGNLPDDLGNSHAGLDPNSHGVLGLHGLTLTTASAENTPVAKVTSEGKNVKLDSGTRMLLVTQAAAPQNPPQQ
jgi:hypothetical protein